MNEHYLIKYISYHLHTIVRRYDINGTLLETCCARISFRDLYEDNEIFRIFTGTALPHGKKDIPVILSAEGELAYAMIRTGSRVTGIVPGDLVFSLTPHKLYNRVAARDVFLVPDGILPEKAALCRFPAVSMTAFLHSDIKPTEPVLVSGLGIVGLMCAQVMQRCGFPVYATDPNEKRQEIARSCGLKHVGPDVKSFGLPEKCAGLGMDCSGNDQAILSLSPYIRQLGQLALVGVPWRQTSDLSAHELLRQIFYSYLRVYSGWEWSLPRHSGEFNPNSNLRSMRTALDWIADGSIVTDGIYELFSPEECSSLYPAIAAGKLEKPCAVFDWRHLTGACGCLAGSPV